jgi:hypothetical protein
MKNDWENHKLLQRNRLPARVSFIPFADDESALCNERELSPYYVPLNGNWKFNYAPTPAHALRASIWKNSMRATGMILQYHLVGRCTAMASLIIRTLSIRFRLSHR